MAIKLKQRMFCADCDYLAGMVSWVPGEDPDPTCPKCQGRLEYRKIGMSVDDLGLASDSVAPAILGLTVVEYNGKPMTTGEIDAKIENKRAEYALTHPHLQFNVETGGDNGKADDIRHNTLEAQRRSGIDANTKAAYGKAREAVVTEARQSALRQNENPAQAERAALRRFGSQRDFINR